MESKALEVTEAYSAERAIAPRVTLDSMKANIAYEAYFTVGDAIASIEYTDDEGESSLLVMSRPTDMSQVDTQLGILTICVLTMRNGFTIIGKSAPASPENFDAEKGRTFAFEDAIEQLWPLEGYLLRHQLSSVPEAPPASDQA